MSDQSSNRFIDSLRLFVEIARLRRGPEDLPVDRALLMTTILAYGLLNLLLSQLLPGMSGQVVWPLLVDMGMALLWLAVMLQLAHKPERFLQTATAVFGFQLVVSPVFLVALSLFTQYQKDATWQVPVMVLVMALGIWTLVVNARILLAATRWPVIFCVAMVLGEALVGRLVLQALFPETGAAAAAA